MIDHVSETTKDTNTSTPKKLSSPISETLKGESSTDSISELIQSYVKDVTSIHKQRLERVEEANQILAKQYRSHETELQKTKQKKVDFNKELDAMIGILKQIDRVQSGVVECEKNGKMVFELLAKIEKKLAVKLQQKAQKLEKIKKNKQ